MGKWLDSPEKGMSTKCPKHVDKLSKNVEKMSGGAENTMFGHFLGNFSYLVNAFVW